MPKAVEKEVKEVNPAVMVVGEEVDLKAILNEVKSLREDMKNLKFLLHQFAQLRTR